MRSVFKKYQAEEEIPVYDYVRQRKLVKYYTRETMAAMVAMGQLYQDSAPAPDMPFFYSTGEVEMMEFYNHACSVYAQKNAVFSSLKFIEDVLPAISPLAHFKMMRNMTQCFLSIEYGLKGDNAALLASEEALFLSALHTPTNGPILIGTGRLYGDGAAECGLIEATREELEKMTLPDEGQMMDFIRSNQIKV